MNNYKKNKKILEDSYNYKQDMEHDACGVGLIASTNGKKSRRIVEYGIKALKAIWHRGAVDADGKSGDGAGIQIEIAPDFFKEKILATGHSPENDKRICVGMIFLPRTDYSKQEKCREIIESALLEENYNIYGWRQVPINPNVLGKTADQNRPEIAQVMFKKNEKLETNDLERDLFETRKKIEKVARESKLD
jgi:glutamate synthase (NADPH/NADH) large chain